MKYKNCKLNLVCDTLDELQNCISQFKNEIFFKNVEHTKIKKVDWSNNPDIIQNFDYRTTITFISKASKNNIYYTVNLIKPNPIIFN